MFGAGALRCWTTAVVLLFLASHAAAQGPTYGTIVGQVRVARGSFPPRPVLIHLATRGATIASAYTDNEGRFAFGGLLPNLYTLTINEQDYAPVYERIPLSPSSMPLRMLHISLVPKEEIAKPKADAETERIPGSNPNVVDPAGLTRELPQLAIREFKAGIASEHKNDIEEAIRHYQKAIEIAPEFYEARNNLGSLHLGRSEFEAARQQFQEAMRLNPAEARAHFNMANLMLITHQPVKAQSIARDGLRLQPSSAFGHFVLGSALERSSDMAEAEQELRRALELDPAMAKARLQLVNVYLRQNRKAEAMNELRAFLKAAPDDPLVARAREVLKRLESERASK